MDNLIKQRVDLIAECIFNKIEKSTEEESQGFYSGEFGILLFLFYYSRCTKNRKHKLLTENYAEKLFNKFLTKVKLHSFCDGFSGILYLFEFLRENDFIDMDVSHYKSLLNNYLITRMRHDVQQEHYDFMHGSLGVGLYFLKQKTNLECIHELIDFLYEISEKYDDNKIFKWKSIIGGEKNLIGYNLSLSHGISSIMIFLSRVIRSGMKDDRIIEMLNGAVNYVLSQQRDFMQFGSHFPSYLFTTHQELVLKSRLAWCYGDLGVGIALWQAGKAMDDKELKDKSLEILLQSTKRKITSDTFVVDAGICHGCAGIAFMYRRMYLETMKEEFKEATDFWIAQTLTFSKFENGLAGFMTYTNSEWKNDYSLLTGISGIGIVLMSYITDNIQSWDEMFLLSG